MSADERRKHTRYPSQLRCWLRGPARQVYVRLRDISRGGLGLRAPTTFPRGEVAEVLVEDPRRGVALRARGEVVWTHPDPDHPDHTGTGIRFLEVTEGLELLPAGEASEA
ncbi:MAG TPA: PilZ domain-containing protein [Polyangia bacterium]